MLGIKRKKKDTLIIILTVVIALVIINFFFSRHFVRIDLTEKEEYTLSDSTKSILKGLKDVVNIKLYFSKELPPAVVLIKREVDDLLSEYRNYAGNKLYIEEIDPQESPQAEYQVQLMGIPPVQVNVIAKDKQELVKLYLGMAIEHGGKKQVIPVIGGSKNLEYELTSAILQVSSDKKPEVVWLSDENSSKYSEIKKRLDKRYRVTLTDPGSLDLKPENDSLVILTLEKDLSKETINKLQDYLAKGGKVFLMVDTVAIGKDLKVINIEIPNISEWLGLKGITVEDKLILDRSNTHAAFTGGYITYHVPYPYWIKVGREGFNHDNPIVSDLEALVLPWVSPIELDANPEFKYTILAASSPFNKVVPTTTSLMPEEAQMEVAKANSDPKPLAVLGIGQDNSQIIAMGNTRFIQNSSIGQFQANTIFFENIVDYMAMGNALIGIRSKGMIDRPVDPEISSGKIAVTKYINIIIGPIILIIIGLLILMFKRHRNKTLKEIYR